MGLDPAELGTHSLRRSKAALIYRRTGNSEVSNSCWPFQDREHVCYLDVEIDDAIKIAEKIDI